jgi:predicted glycogen debranching enzyme
MNHASFEREWLVTNGIGGFASGTVGGLNTRRYHGLLVASLRPPVERTVMVAKLDAQAQYADVAVDLATNEYADGTVHPQGFRHLHSFRLDGQIPVWTWLIRDALLEQRVWMAHGENTTYVGYKLLRGSRPLDLRLAPLCTYRDYHWHHRGFRDAALFDSGPGSGPGFEVIAYPGATPYRILLEGASYELATEWHWNHKHREESARGLDDTEDLFRPAIIRARLMPGESAAVILTAESGARADASASAKFERERQAQLVGGIEAPDWIRQLRLAADQFIVERRDEQGRTLGGTVIAGYPWFSDWGRDTMIALPGLALTTGRIEVAASILRTFARFVSEGMIPNRFPDAGEQPEYNTVDATLWFFIAAHEYFRREDDASLRADLYPILADIVAAHVRGTRFGIRVDPSDGLLFSGEPGVQLTWMDAKIGDWVVTPRIGKCVEINALWINALLILRDMAERQGDRDQAAEYAAMAARAARSFEARFWHASGGYLYDVIDGPDGMTDAAGRRLDASIRPNQLFAISLPHELLPPDRAASVVAVCARELWTPVGLRSLAPSDPDYAPRYAGGPRERDAAYHQGTAWSWLLGPFALAHHRVHGDATAALEFLSGMESHLNDACAGQVSEIFDGEAPFTPRGCFAQAWGVSETLRAWSELNECRNDRA